MTAAAWIGVTGAYLLGAGLTAGTILLQMATNGGRGVPLWTVPVWPVLWLIAIAAKVTRRQAPAGDRTSP